MPSVRFSRDKRGYEYVYLVHTPMRRGRPGRSRVLYWYRTPPGVRIGRKPFDPEIQVMLERQNPGVTFDWDTIVSTPMPPPDMTEFWRERRRAEKIARQERRAMEAVETAETSDESEAEPSAPVPELAAAAAGAESERSAPPEHAGTGGSEAASQAPVGDGGAGTEGGSAKKRRRRRGGRRRRAAGEPGAGPHSEADASADVAGSAVEADSGGDPSEADDQSSEGE